jgi:TPR repeat protein
MHSQGQGFDQDDVEAANWYMLAADEGYIPAQWRLAILHYHGSGVPQDYKKALDLYTTVAQSGDPYAQKMIGTMYSNGLGVQQDRIKAHMWFQRRTCCRNGSRRSCIS